MICVDVKKRITAKKLSQHPWILKYKSGCCENDKPHDHEQISKEVIEKLRKFRGESLLKRTAINIMIK